MKEAKILIGALVLSAAVMGCGQPQSGQSQAGQAETEATNRFSFVEHPESNSIAVLLDGQPYTSYCYADSLKKPVLYPLRTKGGHFITRGWPVQPRSNERTDHPHHIGLWFNYGDVNGLDFWNNSTAIPAEKRMGYGSIHHAAVNGTESSGNTGVLDVTKYWQGPQGDSLLKEDTRYVFQVDSVGNTSIELDIKLTALTDVSLNDNKEGVLGIRLARALEHPSDEPAKFTDANGIVTEVAQANNDGVTGHYISSEGIEGDDVWGTRAKWVTLNGTIEGEDVSLVILDHAGNPGYPTYWHARGYGLFAANPLGQKALSDGKDELNFKLDKDASARFRYKILIHAGSKLDTATINDQFAEFGD
ncbi:PmoA family protein [Parapedobacter sp. 10938]|uniref:DUF6807 domain-containing protein n=1 Tax=Parapedobacter flavus TaxID=3110225 RepID=UPI002DBDED5C|nr:PmoA family protein [Parapedobacter sp. 10938]MEC3878863.1 PmoA family protein [Parapedobacter sp. 10938]